MPLRALIDGQSVVSPLLSAEEWDALRDAVRAGTKEVVLPCCQRRGFLRVSSLGTKHFVHRRKEGCAWEPETVAHLRMKEAIALACAAAGWDVTSEASGPGWRADVLAESPGANMLHRIALVVQLSRQTYELV